jgi:hypothetical protein
MLAREQFGCPAALRLGLRFTAGPRGARLPGLEFMRDPTRGGLATVAHEIARACGHSVALEQRAVPLRPEVVSVCEMLGYDPYYLACEGRVVAVADATAAKEILARWQTLPEGADACIIGRIEGGDSRVILETDLGGRRILDELDDDPLPRICWGGPPIRYKPTPPAPATRTTAATTSATPMGATNGRVAPASNFSNMAKVDTHGTWEGQERQEGGDLRGVDAGQSCVPSAWNTMSRDSSLRSTPNRIGTPSATGSPSHQLVTGVSARLIQASMPTWPSSASTTLPATSSGSTMVTMSRLRSQVLVSKACSVGTA